MKNILIILLGVIVIGFLIPQNLKMPVSGASNHDYNSKSFWYYPWGKSITHKGVDVFSSKGTEVRSSTFGLVLSSGNISMGGNYALVLGPKWRLHYYAHMDKLFASRLSFVTNKSVLGTIGATGNAVGKQPHLHYSIVTIMPYLWRIDSDKQGWKKMFYLNPIEYFEGK